MTSPLPFSAHNGTKSRAIQLTTVEETLRRLLLDVADFIAESPVNGHSESQVTLPPALAGEKTVLRFTGGWVRDKLLGVDSHDIDVAINNMTGYQFGLRMREYLDQPGNLQKYGLDGVATTDAQSQNAGANSKTRLVGGLHKIEANPEKSKHLETVTTRILGLDIDLVNLRKETYSEDSRNPQMEFGTPEEDALRRDATINAMFYNLNTLQIEDLTSRGFSDMEQKIIRTPLEPYQTFKDDPLRVLRLIRFASRLSYTIDPAAADSMRNADIKEALKIKISRERVGVELEKMLRGPDPAGALQLISEAGLYTTVFSDPTATADVIDPDVDTWHVVREQAAKLLNGKHSLNKYLIHDEEDRFSAWTLACLVPYRNAPQQQSPPGKKQPPPVATQVAREGFKAPNKMCEVLTAAVKNASEIGRVATAYGSRNINATVANESHERGELGVAIRQWGSSWRLQTVFALLAAIADQPNLIDELFTTYGNFASRVNELGLSEAYTFRPLLDGKQLAKAMGLAPGPWMKDALDVVMAWQLRNPGSTDVSKAVEEVRNSNVHGELTDDLVKHFLSLTIRPLFTKNPHPAVTDQGRKNKANSASKPIDITFDEVAAKPWKKREHQALEITEWVIRHLDEASVERHWHLIIPPLLSIIDDNQVSFKARGCELVTLLLQRTPSGQLTKTGLFDVFREALMPCFGFLPSLTPEDESIDLLNHAFPALLALHSVKFRSESSATLEQKSRTQSVQFLDTLIRQGVLSPYAHCPENVRISIVILRNFCTVNDALGLESIKHLKHYLPLLNEILCNPFGAASPDLLLVAIMALQSVIRNSWPRVLESGGEMAKGLCLSWINVADSDRPDDFEEFRREAKRTADMLRRAVEHAGGDWTEYRSLVEADSRLEGLLDRIED